MASTSLRKYIDYLQPQENIPCCTACATLLAAEITMACVGNSVNLSRLFLYYMTQKMQGRLNMAGVELGHTLETLNRYGAPPEKYWSLTFYRIGREPHEQAMEEAARYRALSYSEISPLEYKDYLGRAIPIIIGIRTGELFWDLQGQLEEHKYKPVNGSDNKQSNGHAATIIGYDDDLNGGSWIIANSLGPQWGFQGYAAIPYSCNVDIGESYVINNFAGISAGKKISEI